jgi:hypothetical protein
VAIVVLVVAETSKVAEKSSLNYAEAPLRESIPGRVTKDRPILSSWMLSLLLNPLQSEDLSEGLRCLQQEIDLVNAKMAVKVKVEL